MIENILCFSSQEQLYNICCLNSSSAPIKDCIDPGMGCVEMGNARNIKDYQSPLIYAFKCLTQGYNCNFNHICSVCALNTEVSMCQLEPSKAAGIFFHFNTFMFTCKKIHFKGLKARGKKKKKKSDSFNYNCQKKNKVDRKFQLASNGRIVFCFAFKHFKNNLLKVGGALLFYVLWISVTSDATRLSKQLCWEELKVNANNTSFLKEFYSGFYVWFIMSLLVGTRLTLQSNIFCFLKSYFECLKPSNI